MKHPFLDSAFCVRWNELKPECVEADIAIALEHAQAAVDAIAKQARDQVSYESTLGAFEKATVVLNEAWAKVGHLDAVCNSPELRKAYNAMLPKVSDFFTRLYLNEGLWLAIKAFAQSQGAKNLTPVRERFLQETLQDFRDCGADLPAQGKERLAALNAELAQLTQKYSENVLDATNAWEWTTTDANALRGLPPSALASAQAEAAKKATEAQNQPQWRFTLHAPSMLPVLMYAEDRALRERFWRASAQVGAQSPHDNTDLIWQILALRHEKAQLLGFKHFADYTTQRRMAKTGAKALAFIEGIHERIRVAFTRDIAQLTAFRSEQGGGTPESLEPWDTPFWSERLRKAHYALSEEDLRPYFPIDRVITGLFDLAQRVFAVKITQRTEVEVWHEEVKYYDMHDADGRHMGSFYADWHPRPSKRGGAWMNHFRTGGWDEQGQWQPHLGVICGNLTPAIGGKPALLTHREVETIFHEFGHLLHHLCGKVEVRPLSGINVVWDFVELPSQIMENWCWERESLDLFARHYETGEPIPQPLFEKMVAARRFQAGLGTMRQLSFGKMDLELHLRFEQWKGQDLDAVLKQLLKDYTVRYQTEPQAIVRRFTHLFGDATGYAAGYYSYKWAEVLDADAFTRFKKEGILNARVGQQFRECILAKGNSEPAEKLYHDFMGRNPDPDALLRRSGLL